MFLPIDAREAESNLVSRATCYSRYRGYYTCNRTTWSRWGRWLLAGLLIFVGVLFLFVILCTMKRRRRRNQIRSSNQPMAYQPPVSNTNYQPPASNDYYSQPQQQYAPPAGNPPYYGENPNYGGNTSYGVTQPQNAYTK